MKKLLVSSLGFFALAIIGTGCLKDKGFEDGRYGTQITEVKGVSFPQSRSSTSYTVALVSSTSTQSILAPVIALEANSAQASDVHVTLQVNNSLVDADTTLTQLPASEFSVNLNQTIVAGQLFDTVEIIVPNSATLDPNITYGLGLSIVSADNGFQVAANMKDLVFRITIKNKYDGLYEATGTFVDLSNPAFVSDYPLEYNLITTGPNSVNVSLLVNGEIAPAFLFLNGAAGTLYGSWGLQVWFDAVTDEITEIRNYYGDPNNSLNGVGNPALGTGAPLYAASNTRRAELDPTGINAWTPGNATDPAMVQIKYFMFQPSIVAVGPRSMWDETWTYTGPRP